MLTVHTLHSFKSMNGKLTFLVLKTNRPITHSAVHAHIHFSFIYTVLSCLELLLLKRPYNNTEKTHKQSVTDIKIPKCGHFLQCLKTKSFHSSSATYSIQCCGWVPNLAVTGQEEG